ncbi:lactate utilization protein [Elizabethkingia bruuniana]|uniref:Lactate utilization protein n=1 Tax=Elizabethkingia bruuniana TaxID=1756149 RepID=A0A7T7V2T6_9FLAO|nr:lactate utilization protein B [Elizabethkingia bruuniana]KGO10631.1 4Fe-4S ferredoxin [Elizabethkingia miricola]AQX87099.1 4Fe-4S ferredoxin [Elizabethkingia bruuniana]KUY26655.1 4Fe-4S ferredoxin [Elizabethkingia bruuniana]OPB66906.1 4Fe-4S ferredoxin [Elizabethkingia bruuniana]QQN60832.1 lactate utilization protein [Elizabethkingia bruuniana]
MKNHATLAEQFNRDEDRVDWHNKTLWFVREKRDRQSKPIPDWEKLRETASKIKLNVLSNLDTYLIEFEKNALENGIKVHWAKDAAEHNAIVLSVLEKHQVKKMVKSKSMLTEECHLNDYLEKNGIEVTDTDLGERIVQLAKEPPSHIVLPCIHKKKEEIGEIFHEYLNTPKGLSDPQQLTEIARQDLRKKFLQSQAALTGVNFAVAETGEFVVCTNEGNADMGAHLANVHIACMGLEKIIPKREHLGVFLRLLTRSATGQPITTYSSHFRKPREGQEMHLVIVDNGRSEQLGREKFRNSLKCIRCGACFNTCPVYRRSGGHSYHTAVAGPIGSVLSPARNIEEYKDLPFASTLCGSCTNVCPVQIDLHNQLYELRQEVIASGLGEPVKNFSMKLMARSLSNAKKYEKLRKKVKFGYRYTPFLLKSGINPWYKHREMPEMPEESFKEWYKKNVENGK